jgi:hypothetical protein
MNAPSVTLKRRLFMTHTKRLRERFFPLFVVAYKQSRKTGGKLMTDHSGNSTGPISKKQLLAEMQSEQAAWLALLDEIGEENMTQPEVAGGWSIKDIVAHITGWRRRTVLRFRAALDPTVDMTPYWPAELDEDDEVDEINAWIYKANRDRPLADVLNDSREVFQQLVAEVSALSDEQLNDPQRFPWLEGERLTGAFIFGHFHEEHEPDMRAWLSRVKQTR